MSKVYTDTVTSIEASQDLTLGRSGDNVIVTAGATLKTNTVKDSGGNTLWTSDGSGNLSSVNTALGGNMVLLSTQTASNAASVSFTSGIDSTYKLYIFKYYDVNPATDNIQFSFQCSTDGGSNYNTTMTTTFFRTSHDEADTWAGIGYLDTCDQHQGTSYQQFGETDPGIGNGSDESGVGILHLFSPSNTTYVKHFYARSTYYQYNDRSNHSFVAGYFNTTSAIDAISFKMASGNFDGTVKMYGVG